MEKEKRALSIVIPSWNEAPSLQILHGEICAVCDGHGIDFEVIYVDDCSTDDSFGVLSEIHQKDPRVKIVQFRRNYGKAEALSAGFAHATGRLIVTLDADLQDDPSEIPRLIDKIEEGFDLVSGWKKKRRDPITKRWPSRLFNFVVSRMTRVPIHDFNCGFKIYRHEVVESLHVYGELYRYIPALAAWQGFRIAEIPVNHRQRKYGKSKFGSSRLVKGFLDLITVLFLNRYTKRPLHVFGFIGLCSFILGCGITGYLIVLRLLRESFLSNRPLFFVGVMLVVLGIQFISIGLLGEMITRSQAHERIYTIRRTLGV